ncbi:MAG: GNAT family protein [Aeromicrobium sp.]|uniref:GNAT family N-acetyltransferase n=1 Tax=Aeromicrobium sp. TaxID=1871063 RepID=UPI0039E26747
MSWGEAVPLAGERVRLEPMTRDHAAGITAAADDDAVFEHLRIPRPVGVDGAREMIDGYLAMRPGLSPWVQVVDGEVAGMTTYYDLDESLRTVAIGHTWLGRRFWRTRANTEAKLLLLAHAFEALDCVRVVWHVDLRNARSQAAVLRLGATREGVLRKHKQRRDGSWRDTVVFSMTDDDWPEAQEALVARLADG